MDPDIKFPECEKQYGCDVEYIRADLVEAAVKRALEGAASFLDEMALQNGYTKTPRGRTAIHYARKVRTLDPAQFVDGEK